MGKKQTGLSECDITFDYKNITFLRVLATIGIFILHEGTKHNLTTIVSMMGFAVPMFFYMSAIIYGTRELNYFDAVFLKNYAKISRIAKNELFMSFSPQQR